MPNGNVEHEVSWRLTEAKCTQLRESISAARLPFFISLLWGFVWLVTIYNHEFGYNRSLLRRYETALSQIGGEAEGSCWALKDIPIGRYHRHLFQHLKEPPRLEEDREPSKAFEQNEEDLEDTPDPAPTESEGSQDSDASQEGYRVPNSQVDKSIDPDGLDEAQKPRDSTSDSREGDTNTASPFSIDNLDFVCYTVLIEQHKKLLHQQVETWELEVPVFGIKLLVFDLGVIGNGGLLLLSIWFFYAARRENHSIRAFVEIEQAASKRWFLNRFYLSAKDPSLRRRHYLYAYNSVAQRFLFLLSDGSGPLLGVTTFLLSFPTLVAAYNGYTDIRDFFELTSMDSVNPQELSVRLVAGSVLLLALFIFSVGSLRLSIQTGAILNGWHLANRDCWETSLGSDTPGPLPRVLVDRDLQRAQTVKENSIEGTQS